MQKFFTTFLHLGKNRKEINWEFIESFPRNCTFP